MSFTVLIPARLASTRLPHKPLADIGGVPMVVRVAQRALASRAKQVAVAADHASIIEQCIAHGIDCVLTRPDHLSGSDRLAEASLALGLTDSDVVVNVQGDEPLIDPALIDAVARLLETRSDCAMSTAAHAIDSLDDWLNPNIVKLVTDRHLTALYFSRAPIPAARDGDDKKAWWHDAGAGLPVPLRHVGIYSYRTGFLRLFPTLPPAPIEALESLEQLRALWHGYRIAVHITAQAPGPGVDTPADLARVQALFAAAA